VGDTVWLSVTPDLPPVRGIFTQLGCFTGPEYELAGGEWKTVDEGGRPAEALLTLIPDSVLKEHLPYLEDYLEDEQLRVDISDCTAYERWPVLEG
jgi:hypothetical protein